MSSARDELTPVLKRAWKRRLQPLGFHAAGVRDLVRLTQGVAHLFNFQLASGGARDFCVNVAAFTLAGNDMPVLEPGFRLKTPERRRSLAAGQHSRQRRSLRRDGMGGRTRAVARCAGGRQGG